MRFLGVDPGMTGAIGVIDAQGGIQDVFRIPQKIAPVSRKSKAKPRREIHAQELMLALDAVTASKSIPCFAVIEAQVFRPEEKNHVSAQALIESFAGLKMALDASGIKYKCVFPVSWKFHTGMKGKKKKDFVSKAQNQWPALPKLLQKDHDLAEALLIADYARLLHKRGYFK